MTAQRIKQIIGLILLCVFITYLGYKLFSTTDTLLAVLILVIIIFVTALVLYVLAR